jgi:cytoskeleton protein RodZ
MNQSQMVDADTPASVDLAGSPGQQLRAQRQARGIEIERIASQLHLRKDVVDALEQDRYDALPAPVYVAGYLRNYARLLGLDSAALIQAYHAALPHSAAAAMAAAPATEPTAATLSSPESTSFPKAAAALAQQRRLVMRLIGAGVLGTALALGWIYRADLTVFFVPPAPTAEDAAVNLSASTAETESPVTDTSAPSFEVEPETVPAMPPSAAATPAAIPASIATPPAVAEPVTATVDSTAAAPTAPPEVMVECMQPARIRVTGADGRTVLRVRLQAGEQRVLSGTPPYQFLIGQASAIKVTVGGQPFDVMAHAKGKSARFSLDPATFLSTTSAPTNAAAAPDDE